MGIAIGPRLAAFAAEPNLIIVGTIRSNGSVQMNPVWFELRDGELGLNAGPQRGWLGHLRREPRVTLLLMDPKSRHRWAQFEGRVVSLETDLGMEHYKRLGVRYTGQPYRPPEQARTIVRVEPLRLVGEDERQPWG